MIPNTLLAFEVLMQETPYSHFDSGCDGITPECRTCRFHRPHWKYQSCVFQSLFSDSDFHAQGKAGTVIPNGNYPR